MTLKGVNLFAWLPVSFWQIIMLEDLWSSGWGRISGTMASVIVENEISERIDKKYWKEQLTESGFLHVLLR